MMQDNSNFDDDGQTHAQVCTDDEDAAHATIANAHSRGPRIWLASETTSDGLALAARSI